MGIKSNKIFVVGTLSINNVKKPLSLNFFKSNNERMLVSLTFHPTNYTNIKSEIEQIKIILESLEEFKDKLHVIITANYEKNSEKIISYYRKFVKNKKNYEFLKIR